LFLFFSKMGSASEKHFFVGQSLNDDIYHTLVVKRRGAKVKAIVDDDAPVLGKESINIITDLRKANG